MGAYRSGLEAKNQQWLEQNGVKAEYESHYINYVIPASDHKYTPDFILPNGIIVETKGIFDGAYRSGLEAKNQQWLEQNGVKAEYESHYINYVIPASDHKYTPDFILPNGIIVETKGIFDSDDRKAPSGTRTAPRVRHPVRVLKFPLQVIQRVSDHVWRMVRKERL
uniref:Endonuclease I n=1 Tax=Escherichia virus LS2 TaxID=2743776 RepID=A0A7D5FN20_9CAUD